MKKSDLFKDWATFKKGIDKESIGASFADHLEYSLIKNPQTATSRDLYHALALAARDRLVEGWLRTQQQYAERDVKRIYYLSAEYLMGRALINNLINLDMYEGAKAAMEELGVSLDDLAEEEPDAGLGNGGLGRLAACFIESLATLALPAVGYGIRYEYGIFAQEIRNLGQFELPDRWLVHGNPWEIPRPERTYTVRFGGRTQYRHDAAGSLHVDWVGTRQVIGMAYDTPIDGYDNLTVNTLRLWSARASNEFDLQYFNHGDYLKAVEEKNRSENISKVLYPNDSMYAGKRLRLMQQYFFVSCSVQDIFRRYLKSHDTFDAFPDKVAIQLNDTHPSLAVAEVMRLFIDEHGLDWDKAWDLTVRACAYTNHTLLAEALERWSVELLGSLLPRHLELIYEINRRFLREVSAKYPQDGARMSRMSLIEEGPVRKVRMAHLAIVGSHSVNGVSALHTKLLQERELREWDEFYPGKFNNKTNGVTPRRWLYGCNHGLSDLITERIGKAWVADAAELERLAPAADDADFRREFRAVKLDNKKALAQIAERLTSVQVNPESLFDVQVKRIHEYKRQSLNILHIVASWLQLKNDPKTDYHPRTFIFGGKAAPGYAMAKLIIRLVCHVAQRVNADPDTADRLKVVFLPNYRVSLAERIFPASDISEQISTAGYEASGTGNMKFALNGALTLGTLDGANVEIREAVGDDNIFIFGLTTPQVAEVQPHYDPRQYYDADPLLREALDLIAGGFFSPEDRGLFQPLVSRLMGDDPYLVLADFDSYRQAQERVGVAYGDADAWSRMAILNVARCGGFSSDRTISDYNRDIWHAKPIEITGTPGGAT